MWVIIAVCNFGRSGKRSSPLLQAISVFLQLMKGYGFPCVPFVRVDSNGLNEPVLSPAGSAGTVQDMIGWLDSCLTPLKQLRSYHGGR